MSILVLATLLSDPQMSQIVLEGEHKRHTSSSAGQQTFQVPLAPTQYLGGRCGRGRIALWLPSAC